MIQFADFKTGEKQMDVYLDLHLHLDGAITVEMAKKLAKLQHIYLPFASQREFEKQLYISPECENLDEFLKCFAFPLILLQTKEGIEKAVLLLSEELKKQHVIYAEVRFAPQLHTRQNMSQEDAVLAAIAGIKQAEIPMNLILCCMRGENNKKENIETVELARKYLVRHGGVVALDLAGAEGRYPTEAYRELFSLARSYDIPFTIHAGEAAGADSVLSAIQMGAKRIGHGIRGCDDEIVLKLIKEKNIYLELCPTSNRITKAISDMSKYPAVNLLNQGVPVTINTDDPAIEQTTIANEYRYLEKTFGLNHQQKQRLLEYAADAAFTDETTKIMLKKSIYDSML